MEWVETTGRTVAEALEAALDQLGVDEHDAEVVVVEEPKTALFGLRKSEARVRARVRPTSPRPKRQQRDRRSRTREGRGGDRTGAPPRTAGGSESDAPPGELASVGAAARRSGAAGRDASASSSRDQLGAEDGEGTAGAGAGARKRRRRRGGRSGSGGDGVSAVSGQNDDADVGSDTKSDPSFESGAAAGDGRSGGRSRRRAGGRRTAGETSNEPEEEEMPIEQQAELAGRFVRGVVECFGLSGATTDVTYDEALIEVSVSGDGLGMLIGPHGSTLSALQELTRTVVQRRGTEHGARIVVDVAGYRAKRAAALAQFTRTVAEEVLATGKAHALEPMSASDRKIVHDTVNEIDGVSTSSEGEEDRRHVVIQLASPASPAAAAVEATATPPEEPAPIAGGATAEAADLAGGEGDGDAEAGTDVDVDDVTAAAPDGGEAGLA